MSFVFQVSFVQHVSCEGVHGGTVESSLKVVNCL